MIGVLASLLKFASLIVISMAQDGKKNEIFFMSLFTAVEKSQFAGNCFVLNI